MKDLLGLGKLALVQPAAVLIDAVNASEIAQVPLFVADGLTLCGESLAVRAHSASRVGT